MQGCSYADTRVATQQVAQMWPAEAEMHCAASGVPVAEMTTISELESLPTGHILVGDRMPSQETGILSTFHQHCAEVQAALLTGTLQPNTGEVARVYPEGIKAESTISGLRMAMTPGLHQEPGLGCAPQGSDQAPGTGGPTLEELSSNYWHHAMALAAVQQAAAAAGQMAASYPIMGGSNVNVLNPGLTPLVADGGGPLPVSTFSMIDEVELKRQRRKLSNRESARRSRLRKQAELHEMIEEVQEFTIKNATLSLEVGHLRKCVASIRQQNMLFQDMIAEPTNGNDEVLETRLASCSPGNEQLEENKDASQQGQKQTCWAAASGVLGTSMVSEMNQSVI